MRKLVLLALTCIPLLAFSTPKYSNISPLENSIEANVGNVRSGIKTLPIITWGGDIATIYANGTSAETTSSSLIGKTGYKYKLVREDDFKKQVTNFIEGKTPFLRGTMGMLNSASDILNKSSKTRPVIFYQLSWSAGGDALVVKNNIKSVKDLKGKTIAIQAYGPHMDYLSRVLKDANLTRSDINIKWLPDLTGTDNSPMAAMYEKNIDAVFVITPDALALTSGGNVGTGSEDSVKGARILMSTKSANRVISDVYAVRQDYYNKNKAEIEALAKAMAKAQEKIADLKAKSPSAYKSLIKTSAKLLLDSPEAIADTEGLLADCELVGTNGNKQYFGDKNYLRNFEKISNETRNALASLNIISGSKELSKANIPYAKGLAKTNKNNQPRFQKDQVSKLVSRKQQQGSLDDSEIFSFEVFFSPNQTEFSADHYTKEFNQVVELSAAYGGAIITVEGHSDPMGFLRAKKKGQNAVVLSRIKQSAKNLSIARAQSVTQAIIDHASAKNAILDSSQFEPIGQGISHPSTGLCGVDPCAPKNETEWRSNMRVVFRLIQIEAESEAFMPL